MNSYAIIFAVVLAAAQAMPQGGWGWGPPPPTVTLDMESDSQAIGEADAASLQSTQVLASGTPANIAYIESYTGTDAIVDQYHSHSQFGAIDANAPSAVSALVVNVDQVAAAQDVAIENASGTTVTISNAGADSAYGAGAIAAHGQTSNIISSKKH